MSPTAPRRAAEVAGCESTAPGGQARPGNADIGLYTMSVASELSGLHPQTLRLYERRGLVEPARTQGGRRRYSPADLDRLRHIDDLTSAGVNLEGVRRILDLEAQLTELRRQLDRTHRDAVTTLRGVQALYRAALAPATTATESFALPVGADTHRRPPDNTEPAVGAEVRLRSVPATPRSFG